MPSCFVVVGGRRTMEQPYRRPPLRATSGPRAFVRPRGPGGGVVGVARDSEGSACRVAPRVNITRLFIVRFGLHLPSHDKRNFQWLCSDRWDKSTPPPPGRPEDASGPRCRSCRNGPQEPIRTPGPKGRTWATVRGNNAFGPEHTSGSSGLQGRPIGPRLAPPPPPAHIRSSHPLGPQTASCWHLRSSPAQ